MANTNFRVVATLLALHINKEIVTQFKALSDLSTSNNDQFRGLVALTESSIITLMHDHYGNITDTDNPLSIPLIFAKCLDKFLSHNNFDNLAEFLMSVHDNPVDVKRELAEAGVHIKYEEDGIAVTIAENSPASVYEGMSDIVH